MNAAASPLSPSEGANVVLAEIVEEVTNKFQAGEAVDVEGYSRAHPELADQLRQLLPALHVLTDLRRSAGSGNAVAVPPAPVPVSAAQLGELGDFRVVREIGRGGMGIVYEAVQISLGRRVALKVLPFAAAMDSKQLQRFKNEAQAAAQLHHTNIVPVHAVGCERGVHYYAMQYIEGQTVAALIRDLRQLAGLEPADPSAPVIPAHAMASELLSGRWAPAKPSGDEVVRSCRREQPAGPYPTTSPPHLPTISPPLDPTPPVGALSTHRSTTSPAFFRTVAHLGVQAAEALEHAHAKGIIHRDIKPANLLIDTSGNLWITDFGLARMLSEAGLTMTGDLVGTLRYMSPEQALAKRAPLDHRTDVYSLGVTLYELLTLRPASDGRDRQEVMQQIAFEEPRLPRRLNKAIPAELEIIVRKAIGKNPAERYATAQELADDLRHFLDDKPIRAKRPTLLDWTRKWARRHQGVVATGIGGLIVAVGVLAVSTLMILSAYRTEATERQNALQERQNAVTALYHSRVKEAEAIRRARSDGYRSEVWQRLQEALRLETPEKDVSRLRKEAMACMGDFVGHKPTTWTDFGADINAIALHPNGGPLAIGLNDGTVLLRELSSGEASTHLGRHSSRVTALAFAPDGVRLVSGDASGTMHIYEAIGKGKWALARKITAGPVLVGLIPYAAFPFFIPHFDFPSINCIAITPDAKQLGACAGGVFSSFASTISLWDLANGTQTALIPSGWGKHRSLAFSPDGKFLAATYFRIGGSHAAVQGQDPADIRQGVLLWDLKKGEISKNLSPGLSYVETVSFSPDSKLLACGCDDGVALFDTFTFERQLFRRGDYSGSIAFSSDSQLLAVANTQLGGVSLWNVATNHPVAVLGRPSGFKESLHSVAISGNGKVLVAASSRTVCAWNLAGSGERRILAGHGQGRIPGITFSRDGRLLASASSDKAVKMWDPTTGQLLDQLTGFRAEVQAVAFSPDGRMLATADWAGAIEIWDVESWKKLAAPDHGIGRSIWAVAFSPDGHYFAACGGGYASPGGLTIWRIIPAGGAMNKAGMSLSMQRIARLADKYRVWSLAFSPDSELLAWLEVGDIGPETVSTDSRANSSPSAPHTVHLWDLANSCERSFPRVQTAGARLGIGFHPDGKHLIFISERGVPEAWNVATGQKAFSLGEEEGGDIPSGVAGAIALSSDGAWLASHYSKVVTIWDTASRNLLLKLPEEQSVVYALAWSPKRELLAVGTAGGELAIWNLAKIKAQLDEIGLGW